MRFALCSLAHAMKRPKLGCVLTQDPIKLWVKTMYLFIVPPSFWKTGAQQSDYAESYLSMTWGARSATQPQSRNSTRNL